MTRESPALLSMTVSFQLAGQTAPLQAGAVPVRAVPRMREYELEYQDGFGPIFDCHSHWMVEPLKQKNRRRFHHLPWLVPFNDLPLQGNESAALLGLVHMLVLMTLF